MDTDDVEKEDRVLDFKIIRVHLCLSVVKTEWSCNASEEESHHCRDGIWRFARC